MNYPNPHGPSCPWFPHTVDWGAPNIKWCEETLCQWISEPANTWSNVSYLIVAVIITVISFRKNHDIKIKQFGPIIFFMGAMSFFYHSSNFYGSQILDFIGMFFFVGWAKGMNLIRLGKLQDKHLIPFNIVVAILYTLLMHYMYIEGLKFQGLILLSAIFIAITEIMAFKKHKTELKWFFTGIGLLIIAFGFSFSDGSRLWCDPTQHGIFSQGHAMWHWFAGSAMFFIHKHYSQDGICKKA